MSEREQVVLRYLPTLMSNPEIASELFVSVNTVKTHLKSIYRKLGASHRREAVRRARELRLIATVRRSGSAAVSHALFWKRPPGIPATITRKE